MELMPYLLLVLTGVAAGVLGGLLGVGGSSVMLPAMVLILGAHRNGTDQIHQYMAAAMIVNFLLILPSVLAHARSRAIWAAVWRYLAVGALAGVVLGVYLSYRFQNETAKRCLRHGVGLFFVYVVGHNIYRLLRSRRREGMSRQHVEGYPAWRKLVVGLPMGVIAGLLGIGGGLVMNIQAIRRAAAEGLIDPADDLLRPAFYVVPRLADWLHETAAAWCAGRPGWFY